MQSKSLLIAIAAFAVTATGVQAYGGGQILRKAGFSEDQVSALQEARSLKESGNTTAARDILLEAGITDTQLQKLHAVAKKTHSAVHAAVQAGDYEAFVAAVADGPLAESITTQAEFERFVEAHQLRHAGQYEAAADVLAELGIKRSERDDYHRPHRKDRLKELTFEQREAFLVAKQANDKATMQAILDEAGVGGW